MLLSYLSPTPVVSTVLLQNVRGTEADYRLDIKTYKGYYRLLLKSKEIPTIY